MGGSKEKSEEGNGRKEGGAISERTRERMERKKRKGEGVDISPT